jgi:hypothetical protein
MVVKTTGGLGEALAIGIRNLDGKRRGARIRSGEECIG